MKELEKIVKESFEGFEPQVNPGIWEKLEHQLSAPVSVDPSSAASTAVKGLTGKAALWAGAALLAGTLAVATYFYTSNKEKAAPVKNTEIVNLPAQQQEAPEAQGGEATVSSANTVTPVVEQPLEKAMPMSDRKVAEAQKNSIPPAEEVAASAPSSSTDKHEPAVITPAAHQQHTDQEPKTNPVNQSATPSPEKTAPPAIIINTICGFAPLKVAAIINNANAKGNWEFGDGDATLHSGTASHTYSKQGTYQLSYTSPGVDLTKNIEVIGVISTAFTPNGDGQNDEFFVDADGLAELKLTIFDRNGREVYEITQPGQHWNGKNKNGEDLPSGTYFYDIFARSENGLPITQKGTLNIFR